MLTPGATVSSLCHKRSNLSVLDTVIPAWLLGQQSPLLCHKIKPVCARHCDPCMAPGATVSSLCHKRSNLSVLDTVIPAWLLGQQSPLLCHKRSILSVCDTVICADSWGNSLLSSVTRDQSCLCATLSSVLTPGATVSSPLSQEIKPVCAGHCHLC